jgi:hypothetical protein
MEAPTPTYEAHEPTPAEERARLPIYLFTGAVAVAFILSIVLASIVLLR